MSTIPLSSKIFRKEETGNLDVKNFYEDKFNKLLQQNDASQQSRLMFELLADPSQQDAPSQQSSPLYSDFSQDLSVSSYTYHSKPIQSTVTYGVMPYFHVISQHKPISPSQTMQFPEYSMFALSTLFPQHQTFLSPEQTSLYSPILSDNFLPFSLHPSPNHFIIPSKNALPVNAGTPSHTTQFPHLSSYLFPAHS